MPDAGPARDEVAALRAANARLREVIEAKDIEIAALRGVHQAQLDALRARQWPDCPGSSSHRARSPA